ncbi:MAG: hypothetical protein QOG84_2342 [Sphingomonadales bacterium]|jgi:hypothetical protein|nr:hypothetical protein [Sphingomonadales bacterium]
MGWSSRTRGYPREGALVAATAIFQRLAGGEPFEAALCLENYLRNDPKRAEGALRKLAPDMAEAVPLTSPNMAAPN